MSPTATDIAALAAALERRVARATKTLRASAHPGRSVASLLTLARLEEEGPLRVTDLAAAEHVAQPSMTGLVGRLEHDGLVRRTPDPDDARAVRVVLTDAGRDQIAAVRGARAAALLEGRGYTTPDDVKRVALPALRHRIALAPDALLEGRTANDVLSEIMGSVPAPRV